MMASTLRTYWLTARTPYYGFVAGLALFLLYEALTWITQTPLRNGAEVWLIQLLPLPEHISILLIKLSVIAGLAMLFLTQRTRPPLRATFFGGMALESIGYSLALGAAVLFILNTILFLGFPDGTSWLTQFTLSLGAGLYEEILFRVILFGGMSMLLSALTKRPVPSALAAAIISSLLFAAAHHLGPFGEPWAFQPFAFRTVSGLLFTGLFVVRGFGVTALTHALYDVWIVFGVV